MIERESLSDSELLDNNLARAVCEAPVLVGETLKCLSGELEIQVGNQRRSCGRLLGIEDRVVLPTGKSIGSAFQR